MPIEKLEIVRNKEELNGIEKSLYALGSKINEVIEVVNKISSLERLEKDLKELGEAFDKVK